MKRTAVIVIGALRFSDIAIQSWNFPIDADYFLFTWDLSHYTYSFELFSVEEDISFLRSTNKFIEIHIQDYMDFLKNYNGHHSSRIFFLYKCACDKLRDRGYERVIIHRPDLFLFDNNSSLEDFTLSDNTALILGMHEPPHWIQPAEKYLEDQLFCMSWGLFEKLAALFNTTLALRRSNIGIHRIFFEFFSSNKIHLQPLQTYRCVIIRKSAADAIMEGEKPEYNFLLKEFMALYEQNKAAIKFHRKLHLSKY